MPNKITAFSCAFKCGRVGVKRKSVEAHEGRCFRNPATRSCQTCIHYKFDEWDVGYGLESGFSCGLDVLKPEENRRTQCAEWKGKV